MEAFDRNTHTKELKEWTFVKQGVTFFCWIDARGLKHCTAASEEQSVMESAAKFMRLGGWEVTVKQNDGGMWCLSGSETRPSQPGTVQVFDGEG